MGKGKKPKKINKKPKKINVERAPTETLHPPNMHFEIDPYEIKLIAQFSEGMEYKVCAGWYKKKPVAVKLSKKEASVEAEIERFNREVKILNRVNHENIVKLIGAADKDGIRVMVLQLVRYSYDVQQYIDSSVPKELDIVVAIALLASRAVEYLHSQGIMHGNLHTRNILVAPHVVKLAGFSEAREVEVLNDEEEAKEMRKQDVDDFGNILIMLISSVTDDFQPKHLKVKKNASSSQKDKILDSLADLVDACILLDQDDRPEFTLIRQKLESIFLTIKCAGDLDGLISKSPSSTSRKKKNEPVHDAGRQADDPSSDQHQKSDESIGATPVAAWPMFNEHMEDGGTLEEYILDVYTDTPMDKTAMVTFALRISEAMQYLHAQGFAHRDLDSSHVFLTKNKDFFSLGGASEEKTEEMEHFKADVLSFSEILWELVTNRHGLTSSSEEPSLAGVPDEMIELLMSCGNEEAEDRPDFTHITTTLTHLLNQLTLNKKLSV